MNKNLTIASITVLAVIGIFFAFQGASAEAEPTQENKVPRYSETCAHGHNGFNCPPSLGERVVELEEKVKILEKAFLAMGIEVVIPT